MKNTKKITWCDQDVIVEEVTAIIMNDMIAEAGKKYNELRGEIALAKKEDREPVMEGAPPWQFIDNFLNFKNINYQIIKASTGLDYEPIIQAKPSDIIMLADAVAEVNSDFLDYLNRLQKLNPDSL